jgi:hypothetical protein
VSWTVLTAMALLQLLAGVVRVRAWFHVIRDSWPEVRECVRYRDVVLAHLGGVGWNAVLPAHTGDAVKVVILNERMPKRRLAFLAATTVPPAVVEGMFTVLLVAGLIATGAITAGALTAAFEPGGMLAVTAGAIVLFALLAVVFRRRLRRILRNVRSGLTVLSRPRILATHVAPWLLAARVLRLGAFALVLPALGMPFALAPAVAIMALQGATPSVGAAASAARIALLSAVLAGTGAADVPAERVAEALAAAYGATSAINLAASVAAVAWLLRTGHPGRIVAYIRSAVTSKPSGRDTPVREGQAARSSAHDRSHASAAASSRSAAAR